MIKLTITEKGGEVRALSFDKDEVSIGRVQGNDIVLPKGNISKRHSKLSLANNRLSVADLKSTNGTYVNGRKIGEATVVKPGDKVFVGDFLIVIEPTGSAAESSGARRALPPPPPAPPPRAGHASGASPFEGGGPGAVDDSGAPGHGGLGPSRSRPPAPPRPPRRTIVSSTLMGDGADIGFDAAPPSPLDIESKLGLDAGDVADVADGDGGPNGERGERDGDGALDPLARAAAAPNLDAEASAQPEPHAPRAGDGAESAVVASMFGSTHVTDEDEAFSADFPPPPDDGPSAASLPMPPSSDPGGADLSDEDGAAGEEPLPSAAAAEPGGAPDWQAAEGAAPPIGGTESSVLDALLLDPAVTTIIISPRGSAEVERMGTTEVVPLFAEGNSIAERVWQLANTALPPPPPDNPVVDVRLPDGTRVTALFPPITPMSVSAVIRKAPAAEMSLAEICANQEVGQIVTAALASRRNILIAGDRPALMALAGALAAALPDGHRTLTIGAGVKARAGWIELGQGADPSALVRAAVAFGADHLMVAEPNGADLPDLLLAAARGQRGLIASVAARSAAEALARLEAFCVAAVGLEALVPLVLSTIDLVLFAGAAPDGALRLWEIAEPRGEGHHLVPAFAVRRSDGTGSASALEIPGVSERLAHSIASVSEPLPPHLVRR